MSSERSNLTGDEVSSQKDDRGMLRFLPEIGYLLCHIREFCEYVISRLIKIWYFNTLFQFDLFNN